MYNAQIISIIDFIKNNTDLNIYFWDRVYYIAPIRDPLDTSLYISILSENRKLSFIETLIEFRIVWTKTEIWPFQIQEMIQDVKDAFEKTDMIIWNFKYYQIDILSDTFIWVNERHNHEWVCTMIFKTSR